jgi:hypothetical protein
MRHIATILVVLAVAAGCSREVPDGAAAKRESGEVASGQADPAHAVPSTGRRYTTGNICTLVTESEAEGLLEKKLVRPPEPSELKTPQAPVSCLYAAPNSSGMGERFAQVMVYESHGRFDAGSFHGLVRQGHESGGGEAVEAVTGIGEQAFFAANSLHLLAKGRYLTFQVGTIGSLQKDKTLGLARFALARMK